MKKETKTIQAVILKETEKAALIRNTFYKGEVFEGNIVQFSYTQEKWIPKSLINKIEGNQITLPLWICKKNGLK